jgi:hypothetical protein
MDTDERLKTLLSGCRWVRSPTLALSLIPGLAEHAPALVGMPKRGGEVVPRVPVLCIPALADAVAGHLAEVLPGAASGAPALHEADPAALRDHPLVRPLTELVAQASQPGLRAALTPALALAWITTRLLHGGRIPGLSSEAQRRAASAVTAWSALPPAGRGAALRGLGASLSGALAAAIGVAAMSGAPVPTGGLLRQLLVDPLLFAFPRGGLDQGQGLDVAAAMLGLPLSAEVLADAPRVGAAVFSAVRERAARGVPEPGDALVTVLFDEGAVAEDAAWHPVGGPALISAAPLLAGKALSTAGLSKAAAKAYAQPRSARALSAAWAVLAPALARWDVLSRLVDLVEPVWTEGGRAVTEAGGLPVDPRWSFFVPRTEVALGAVVAVRLSEVFDGISVVLGGRVWARWGVVEAFHELCRGSGASVRQVIGDCGVVVFPAPEHALPFARAALAAFGPGAVLPLDADRQSVRLPDHVTVGLGLALGPVEGGTDGEQSALRGRAVAEALALAGNGRAEGVAHDPLAVRRAGWGRDGLQNQSLVASDAFVRSTVDRARKRGAAARLRGDGGACGGVSTDFAVYPVRALWQSGEEVVAALLLGDEASAERGACELRFLAPDALQEWHRADAHAAADRARAAARAPAAAGMDAPSMSFFGAPGPAPGPARGRADPFRGGPAAGDPFADDAGAAGP